MIKRCFSIAAFVCALSIVADSAAEAQTVKDYNGGKNLSTYTVTRTTGAITLDGRLDEAAWKNAKEVTLVETNTGGSVPLKSTVRMLWDDTNFYVAFYCEDPDAWATFEKEDDPMWSEEVVELFIDPEGNGYSYYEHEINTVNQKVDLFVINAGKRLNAKYTAWKDWDFKNLKSAVFVDGDGKAKGTKDKFWSVEVAVPFDELWEIPQVPPADGDVWRFNAYRIERGATDKDDDDFYAAFSPTFRPSFHTPYQFGKITFKK